MATMATMTTWRSSRPQLRSRALGLPFLPGPAGKVRICQAANGAHAIPSIPLYGLRSLIKGSQWKSSVAPMVPFKLPDYGSQPSAYKIAAILSLLSLLLTPTSR